MYPHDWLYFHQSNYRVAKTGLCPLWVSLHVGHGHCHEIYISGVPGMVQGQRYHSPHAGAPCHPATNEVAECLVQIFKKSLRMPKLPLREALQEFLIQYRRTPHLSGYSPSELLNGRQIRTTLDAMVLSLAHMVQGIQVEEP